MAQWCAADPALAPELVAHGAWQLSDGEGRWVRVPTLGCLAGPAAQARGRLEFGWKWYMGGPALLVVAGLMRQPALLDRAVSAVRGNLGWALTLLFLAQCLLPVAQWLFFGLLSVVAGARVGGRRDRG